MTVPASVAISKRRKVHTYAELWHASDCVLRLGVQHQGGSAWQFLSSVVLTAFSFEAYMNHAGSMRFRCWSELDRLPPWAKFELLCESLNVKFPAGRGTRPLQTLAKVLNFRNTLAHGRSEELHGNSTVPIQNYDAALRQRLLTDWERLIRTDAFAKRAREDIARILKTLHDALPGPKEPLFAFGIGIHGARSVPEP